MKLYIIFAPLIFLGMLDYTPTLRCDNVSHLAQKQEIFSYNVAKLIEYIYSKGYKVTFGEAFRTSEQAIYYAQHGLGIVHSQHCERLEVDLNIVDRSGKFLWDADDYKPFGKYWESLNPSNRSGAFWHRVDADHFEMD